MSDIRKTIIFHGEVQGVGFRYRSKYLAQSLGLTGTVKNQYDGTVLMEVQGSSMAIDKLIMELRRAPFIYIDWIEEKNIPTKSEYGFYIE